ncbi:hypothetical protein C6502_21720 [Candidatus Poribacteria bacterium]|nr:MAG: hypothetical protein C6502_21720 [Candidatus Poribacteria bacterium]
MTQNTTKTHDSFNIKICLPLTIFIFFWCCITPAFAAPERDLNPAMRDIAGEIIAELPKDSGEDKIALIPLNATEPDLKMVTRVLTSLLASQLTEAIGEALIGSERLDWRQYPTDGSLLTPEQVKQYGKSLGSRWLITGHITKLDLVVNLNLFLWDVKTGYLRYVANRQLSPIAALAGLYATAPDASLQPYFLKWQSLPDMDYFALAIEVADPDGDGFNEVLVADEKGVKILKWSGVDLWKHPDLSEARYGTDETPVLARPRRIMLAADRNENDRDEIYIGIPPNRTQRIEWGADPEVTTFAEDSVCLAQSGERLIFGETDANQLTYRGQSTSCWVWRMGKIHLKHPCPLPVNFHSIATHVMAIDRSTSEVAVVDLEGHLQIYHVDNNTTQLSWQTPPIFGEGVTIGDLNGDSTPEIVGTVKNLPSTLEFSDQFIILEQKGDLYVEGWRSPLLDGRIVDMKIADADNDDLPELVVCLRNQKGSQIQFYAITK